MHTVLVALGSGINSVVGKSSESGLTGLKFVSFTARNRLIRVISARNMTQNEKRRYSLL
ncbi:MAG: hypothetical protein DRQ57_19545 [Gammaproteobacteria bacterium]|nr:MAG: hypothetical protein DRQ57_19545 [Gammaproteobacteria bacterium]